MFIPASMFGEQCKSVLVCVCGGDSGYRILCLGFMYKINTMYGIDHLLLT